MQEGIFTLQPPYGHWPAGETYEEKICAAEEEQYLPAIPVPVQHMAVFYNSAAKLDRDFVIAYSRLCTGQIHEQKTVEKSFEKA